MIRRRYLVLKSDITLHSQSFAARLLNLCRCCVNGPLKYKTDAEPGRLGVSVMVLATIAMLAPKEASFKAISKPILREAPVIKTVSFLKISISGKSKDGQSDRLKKLSSIKSIYYPAIFPT